MAFNYNEPVTNSELLSLKVRENFQALSTCHRGPAPPPNPQLGFAWIDTSVAANWRLKWYVEYLGVPQWITLISHIESIPVLGDGTETFTIPFYEGSTPPPMINLDDYDFEDAAGFDRDSDQDVIFRLPHPRVYLHGVKFRLRYCMSTAPDGDVRLRLDYRIKEEGGPVGTGVEYDQTWTVTPSGLSANEILISEDVQIPDGRLSDSVEVVHCRLTRVGTDIQDTHTGQFCLLSIQPHLL